jgi:hypothetical protein
LTRSDRVITRSHDITLYPRDSLDTYFISFWFWFFINPFRLSVFHDHDEFMVVGLQLSRLNLTCATSFVKLVNS